MTKINKHTTLINAIIKGWNDVAIKLIKEGVDVNARGYRNATALHVALSMNNIDIANILLDYNASVELLDDLNATPLIVACRHSEPSIIERILKTCSKNINHKTKDNFTALSVVCRFEDEVKFDILAKYKNLDVNVPLSKGTSHLMLMVYFGNYNLVKKLISLKASINARDDDKMTPISSSVMRGNYKCFEILRIHGAELDCINCNDQTLLHLACSALNEEDNQKFSVDDWMAGKLKIIKKLVSLKSDVNAIDCDGDTPIVTACSSGFLEIVKYLVNVAKVDLHRKYQHGYNILIYACSIGEYDIVDFLLTKERSFLLDMQVDDGRTAMDFIEIDYKLCQIYRKNILEKK